MAIQIIKQDMPGVLVEYKPADRLPPNNIRINNVILYINPDGNVDRTPKVGWYINVSFWYEEVEVCMTLIDHWLMLQLHTLCNVFPITNPNKKNMSNNNCLKFSEFVCIQQQVECWNTPRMYVYKQCKKLVLKIMCLVVGRTS